MNQSYFIKGFPDYRLVRLNEKDFCVLSKKKDYWEEIGIKDETGHTRMCLCNKGVKRHVCVHKLVAEMFVPNPEAKTVVHHIDGDATNNEPTNLMWVTASEHRAIHNEGESNPMYGRIGEKNHFFGKHHAEETIKKLSKSVIQYSFKGDFVAAFPSAHEAERQTRIKACHISQCCNNIRKSAGGFIWSFSC